MYQLTRNLHKRCGWANNVTIAVQNYNCTGLDGCLTLSQTIKARPEFAYLIAFLQPLPRLLVELETDITEEQWRSALLSFSTRCITVNKGSRRSRRQHHSSLKFSNSKQVSVHVSVIPQVVTVRTCSFKPGNLIFVLFDPRKQIPQGASSHGFSRVLPLVTLKFVLCKLQAVSKLPRGKIPENTKLQSQWLIWSKCNKPEYTKNLSAAQRLHSPYKQVTCLVQKAKTVQNSLFGCFATIWLESTVKHWSIWRLYRLNTYVTPCA